MISLISLMRTWKALEVLEFVLAALDFILELGERSRIALLGFYVLVEPTRAGLVLRKRRDEILARHSGLLDAQEHDLLLEQTDLGHVLAEIVDQLIEHLRGELQFHQFAADLLANLLRLGVLRSQLVERNHELMMDLRERTEALGRFFRIRTGVDRFLVLVAVRLLLVVGGLFALEGHHFRILGLGNIVGSVGIDEADDDVDQAHLTRLYRFVVPQQQVVGAGVAAERYFYGLQAFFNALRDANFALASQQLHGAHLAHVHAHRIGGAAELGVEICERRGGFLDSFLVRCGGGIGQQQRLGVRRLLVHRNAHVVNHVDDVFDLFRIDDLARQMVVDFSVSEVALLLAARDQQFELRLTLVRNLSRGACWGFFDQGGRLMKNREV